jgi:cell division protease FtsH
MAKERKDYGPASPPPRSRPWLTIALAVLGFIAAVYVWFPAREEALGRYEIPYTQFKALVGEDKVAEVRLRGHELQGRLREPAPLGPKGESANRFATHVPAFGDEALLPALERHGVEVRVAENGRDGLGSGLLAWLPSLVFLLLLFWLMQRAYRNVGGLGGGDLRKFLEPFQKTAKVPEVTFADVAGQENAKREVQELVDYLRNPDKFRKLGAEIPRGVLLMGPPGTGKTMLAKALAGEAGVPFYSISGSEFIEVFVGVGAARVRNLFGAAKKDAPSIIFVDELDSIGRTRGTGLGGGHDEREQTLNQILKELDGFEPHEAVIVLAATNRPDVLDPALLRPGRFDRHVTLDLPDRKDREAVLAVHARKVPIEGDVELARIAAVTPGFSGADLKNLVNEAAILAARDGSVRVAMRHFDEARDKVILGSTRKLLIEPEERHRLAVHESGHAIVAYFLPKADPLYKVSIIPRGRTLGGTQQLPEQERYTLPEDYLRARLAVTLGGRTAEREALGTVSSGADDDIRQATALARAMVARWGMSPEIGPVDLRDSEEHPFLGREIAQPRRFSETSAEAVDKAVRTLLHEAEERAAQAIRGHRGELDALISALEKEESLERERIEACLGAPARALREARLASGTGA